MSFRNTNRKSIHTQRQPRIREKIKDFGVRKKWESRGVGRSDMLNTIRKRSEVSLPCSDGVSDEEVGGRSLRKKTEGSPSTARTAAALGEFSDISNQGFK